MKKFSIPIGVAVLAVVLLVIGVLIHNQSAFAVNTVQSQLSEQGITFTPVSGLSAAQKTHPCLIANAGKPLITGAQAECYANYQIALDLLTVDHGKSYYQASYPARLAEVKAATMAAEDPSNPALPKLQAQAAQLEAPASTLFQGQSLRGMLLTTYAFSHLGDLGNSTATVLFILAGLSLLVSIGLFALRARRPEALAAGGQARPSAVGEPVHREKANA